MYYANLILGRLKIPHFSENMHEPQYYKLISITSSNISLNRKYVNKLEEREKERETERERERESER